MRTYPLASVVCGAALALATPASPAAAQPQSAAARCKLSITAEPHLLTTGENGEIFGALRCPVSQGASVGQTVTIFAHTVGIRGLRVVATTTTHEGGAYATPVAGVTADTVFYASAAGVRSHSRAVRVAPLVTFSAVSAPEDATLKTGPHNQVTFAGTVFPADGGAQVVLEREAKTSNEEWVEIQRGVVQANGGFVLVHKFVRPGDANLRVVVQPQRRFDVRGISNTLSFQISQAQNPNLEINSSADPVGFGEPLTISGTIKAADGTPVTLFGRPNGAPGAFAKLGETKSSGGAYQFKIPLATASSFYYVTGGGFHSAFLFQGVRYRLLADPPAKTTVQAGSPLTFTGTVTPSPAGKDVYLERQNTLGPGHGFHVVDAVPLQGSAYTIQYWFFGSGSQVYRVRVPGDPSDQATGGTPFTIEVTPARGLLRPFPQPTLPH